MKMSSQKHSLNSYNVEVGFEPILKDEKTEIIDENCFDESINIKYNNDRNIFKKQT